uniref:Uncharacterized protein n=1 Tax=Loigolactobacillus rennini TaxID=238013 RepID=A0A1K2I7M7_9LACO|nr:hypothetical protein LREN565_0864 [Loigolactobacillus rennini]
MRSISIFIAPRFFNPGTALQVHCTRNQLIVKQRASFSYHIMLVNLTIDYNIHKST